MILLSVNPFLEELYWRGYIFHRLANTYKQHTAYSDFLYGIVLHLVSLPVRHSFVCLAV
nr:CPBP family glutamic-type intramembrane protease [Brevibacillus borstelensis]